MRRRARPDEAGMNLLPLALGAALGLGILLCWQGFRRMTDKELGDGERRKGLWRLNAGLLVAALSMLAFALAG